VDIVVPEAANITAVASRKAAIKRHSRVYFRTGTSEAEEQMDELGSVSGDNNV
jgi:hypothetical protein